MRVSLNIFSKLYQIVEYFCLKLWHEFSRQYEFFQRLVVSPTLGFNPPKMLMTV